MSKKKFYVVWEGRKKGIFDNWEDCKQAVFGFNGAKYKSFTSIKEAQDAWKHPEKVEKNKKKLIVKSNSKPILNSISVDAACSGNPGKMEYRGVDTRTGEQLFLKGPFEEGTNNVGEFLALVHAIALLDRENVNCPIYSDSKIAMTWVRKKKCNTKLSKTSKNKELFDLVERAEKWLANNTVNQTILKWETKIWGEIPADFGRK